MLRDLVSNVKQVMALVSAVKTADADGATIDTQGYRSAAMLVNVGDSGDTLSGSLKIELEMEHSDNGSAWSDCADADISAPVTGTNTGCFAVIDAPAEDQVAVMCGYKGNKRYIRVVLNVTGSHSTGTPIGAIALLGNPNANPVS